MNASPPSGSGRTRRGLAGAFAKLAGKHLGPALVAALAMWMLGRVGWLDGLERAMVELAAIVAPASGRAAPTGAQAAARPAILAVDDRAFERDFRERTPLDRRTLLGLLEPVLAASPRVIAIDLDLSPILDANEAERAAQAALDARIAAAAATTPIVLAVPAPSDNAARTEAAARWMRALCAAPGIHFAYPEVVQNGGVVTKWAATLPALGQVAFAVASGDDGAMRTTVLPPPCDVVRAGDGPLPFLDPLIRPGMIDAALADLRLQPLDVRFLGTAEATPRALAGLAPEAAASLRGRSVFLGGTWGVQDRFATAAARVPGVVVHAAVFHSAGDPIRALPEWLLVVIATLAGTVVLIVFERPWTRYFEELQRLGEKPPLGARIRAERWTLVVLLMLVAGLVLSVLASGFLLAQATWFNFAPVIVALALRSAQSAARAELAVVRRRLRALERGEPRTPGWLDEKPPAA